MEKSLRYQARREVLQQMAPQYRQASPAQTGNVIGRSHLLLAFR